MDSKILALIATIALLSSSMMTLNNTTAQDQFESFKAKYGKSYESDVEHSFRLAIYTSNMNEIAAHNAKDGITYTKGENQFTDLT